MTTITAPPQWAIDLALETAARSTCRSKRGVVVYRPSPIKRDVFGVGYNGPPECSPCDGSCQRGTCGRRAVHAEMRALRMALVLTANLDRFPARCLEMVHVELAADGGVVACDGPRCEMCSREIADGSMVSGVWLYERILLAPGRMWRRYTADDFHRSTLLRCGLEASP